MARIHKRPKTEPKEEPSSHESEALPAAAITPADTPSTTDDKPNADDTAKRRTLFIRSLPYKTTSEDLSTKFSFVAPIKHATVVIDPVTKTSRGFGFVTFAEAEDAQRAIKEFDGIAFEGRKMRVELAELRHREETDVTTASVTKRPAIVSKEDLKKRSPRLIVRNLPWSVKEPEQLIKIFQSYGKVRNVIIPRKGNKPGGEMCGFAFVTMKGYKNAEVAIEKTNGMDIGGRTVAVDWAVEKGEWEGKKEVEEEEDQEMEDTEAVKEEERTSHDEDGGIGLIQDEEAEDMDNASDASSDAGSEIEYGGADDEEEDETKHHSTEADNSSTLFIRNLPFTTDDEGLHGHFSAFGPVRYARIVIDHSTGRPRGTGFVAFYNKEDCDKCLASAPRISAPSVKSSILQNEALDPSRAYTIEGRTLSVTRAVNRTEATRLQETGASTREKASGDKRHLFLLTEGMIPASSPAFQRLSNTEKQLREASLKQRKTLLQSNPSLHLSLTRLSIRNLPRSITAKDLKALARQAVVGFAEDAKKGFRAQLSKEELVRGGEEDKAAEARRKKQGKGIVRQAKIVEEKAGAGRSRGYGFIEYSSHRWALMGLRWLNGHEVAGTLPATEKTPGKGHVRASGKDNKKSTPVAVPAIEEKKKRLIVEFAIENAQVVARRKDKEEKARLRSKLVAEGKAKPLPETLENKKKHAAQAKMIENAKKGGKGWKGGAGGGGRGGGGGGGATDRKVGGMRNDKRNGNDKRSTNDKDTGRKRKRGEEDDGAERKWEEKRGKRDRKELPQKEKEGKDAAPAEKKKSLSNEQNIIARKRQIKRRKGAGRG